MRRRVDMWMWAEACEFVRRAERLQQRFFEPVSGAGSSPSWEPPVDVFETPSGLHVVVALPGVDGQQIETLLDGDRLVVRGERALCAPAGRSVLHRLEIPNGRFERHIALPSSRCRIARHDLRDGCLTVVLEKS